MVLRDAGCFRDEDDVLVMAAKYSKKMIYRFEQFEVDDREFRLSEHGTPLQVEPKALRLLVYLIENRSRLVRKQELLDAVWPDAIVTENALTRAIGLLRKALNEDSRVPKFIETVPTAGYRFVATVTAVESSAPGPTTPLESPPTAPRPKAGFRASTKWILASSLLLAIAAAAMLLFFSHRKNILTAKDTVVLADFDNSTGDPVFDGTLRQGMAVQLEQSPFLSLVTDERIQQVLRLMGQPADVRLTWRWLGRSASGLQARLFSMARSRDSARSMCSGCAQRTAATEGSWPRSRFRPRGKRMC